MGPVSLAAGSPVCRQSTDAPWAGLTLRKPWGGRRPPCSLGLPAALPGIGLLPVPHFPHLETGMVASLHGGLTCASLGGCLPVPLQGQEAGAWVRVTSQELFSWRFLKELSAGGRQGQPGSWEAPCPSCLPQVSPWGLGVENRGPAAGGGLTRVGGAPSPASPRLIPGKLPLGVWGQSWGYATPTSLRAPQRRWVLPTGRGSCLWSARLTNQRAEPGPRGPAPPQADVWDVPPGSLSLWASVSPAPEGDGLGAQGRGFC